MLDQFHARKLRVLPLTLGLLITLSAFIPACHAYAKELIGASSPVWSPDGKQIAYTVYQDEQTNLFMIDADGTTPIKLADNASEAAWSPDGKQIAYTNYIGDTFHVSLIDVATRKTTDLSIGYSPDWSPDGKQIAYLAGQEIFVANADGSTPRRMITGPTMMVWDMAWSPNGKQLAFSAQGATDDATVLYTINPDGSGLRKIADSDFDIGFSWSPDGSQLIFVGDCGGQANHNICTINSDGSDLRPLIKYRGALQPKWSPDGKQVLFTNSDLYLVNSDGTNQRQLTGQKTITNDSDATWSPDGKRILFTRMHYPSNTASEPFIIYYEVYMMNADGSNMRRLPDGLATL